jgi:hypothetical protein
VVGLDDVLAGRVQHAGRHQPRQHRKRAERLGGEHSAHHHTPHPVPIRPTRGKLRAPTVPPDIGPPITPSGPGRGVGQAVLKIKPFELKKNPPGVNSAVVAPWT